MIDPNHAVARIRAGIAKRHERGFTAAADMLESELNRTLKDLDDLAEYADALPADSSTPARAAGYNPEPPFVEVTEALTPIGAEPLPPSVYLDPRTEPSPFARPRTQA